VSRLKSKFITNQNLNILNCIMSQIKK